MHDISVQVEARVARVLRDRVAPACRLDPRPVSIEVWEAPGEPVPFAEAARASFTAFESGRMWGTPWGTVWFRVRGEVPGEWADALADGSCTAELVVDLGFLAAQPGFQAEALVHAAGGTVLKALEPRNDWIDVTVAPGETFEFYIEAAANPDIASGWSFAPTPLGDPLTAGTDPLYRFGGARLVRRDLTVAALERDWSTLVGLAGVLAGASTRRAGVLQALERAADTLDPDDVPGTAAAAREVLAPALAVTGSSARHRVAAVGHAHIDSAWLWPVRETIRKCARTFSNVLDLMDRHPDFVFAASSAQQYEWMKQRYPEIFARIRERVAEGRWIPVGGMWVESDVNMPGGEALARQFVHGKQFFLREFDVETSEVWLPDSFGYSAALPQIARAAASENVLTQKLSWNETNAMPHHSFLWEGIDGSRVFTHFPPVDTYGSDLSAVELERAERQHAERGVSDLSLVPFGYGDGGGGPTREMIESARRTRDLDGLPMVRMQHPDAFFAEVRAQLPQPPVWAGELYLEAHRGTYTSQARTKSGNRRSEHLLREAELWAATATVLVGATYPADELAEAWQTVLMQQFHDILPGSSIAWVHRQAEENYTRVAEQLGALIDAALDVLAGERDTGPASDEGGVPAGGGGTTPAGGVAFNAAPVAIAGVPPMSAAPVEIVPSRVRPVGDGFVLEGAAIRVEVDTAGRVVSLRDTSGREAIPPGAHGNVLQLFRDTPTRWDAWDIDRDYVRTPIDAVRPVNVERDDDAIIVRTEVGGGSSIVQRLAVSPDGRALDIETTVDWRESQRLLKLAFEFDVHAATAASEIQFGHIRRPTHANTSWDAARFETVAHRWVHVDEPGFGATIANDRVYGHDVIRRERRGGGITTVVRETLLRAPRYPDPGADQGVHVFRHAVSTGGVLDAVGEGYRLNLPLRTRQGAPVEPLVRVEGSTAILIEAVKLADDGSGDVVVRLYEARGGRARGRLVPGFEAAGAQRTDLLERPLAAASLPVAPAAGATDPLELDLRPFELVTLRIRRR